MTSSTVQPVALTLIGFDPDRTRDPQPASVALLAKGFEERMARGERPAIHLPRVYLASDIGITDPKRPEATYIVSAGNSRTEAYMSVFGEDYAPSGSGFEPEFEVIHNGSLQAFVREVLTENSEREAVNPVKEARQYRRAYRLGGFSRQETFAAQYNVSQSFISRMFRLLDDGDPKVVGAVESNVLPLSHAFEILTAPSGEQQREALDYALRLTEETDLDAPLSPKRVIMPVRHLRDFVRLMKPRKVYSDEDQARLDRAQADMETYSEMYGIPVSTEKLNAFPVEFKEHQLNIATVWDGNPKALSKVFTEALRLQLSEDDFDWVFAHPDANFIRESMRAYENNKDSDFLAGSDGPIGGDGGHDKAPATPEPELQVLDELDDEDVEQVVAKVDLEEAVRGLNPTQALRLSAAALYSVVETLSGEEGLERVGAFLHSVVPDDLRSGLGRFARGGFEDVRIVELFPVVVALANEAAIQSRKFNKKNDWVSAIIHTLVTPVAD